MNKERKICGVKVFVSNETYNEYKGTLEEQLEEKDKEIERLNNIINKADNKNLELIELINKIYDVIENKDITGIEARLKIQYILENKGE